MVEATAAVPRRGRVEFTVFGVRCRALDLTRGLERWIRRRWEQGTRIDAPSVYRIDVARRMPPPRPSTHPPASQTTPLDGARLTWLRHAERWWSTSDGGSGISLRLFDRRARIRIWTGSTRIEVDTLLALHVAFSEALRASGLVPLHAAVAVRDGRATALIGPSGVGKSTTLLAAVDDGWLPLAEDFAWLDPTTRRVFGWGGERGVRLTTAGLSRLHADARAAAWRRRADGKFELAYEVVARSRPASAELTRVVVLTRHGSRESMIEPLGPRSAAQALWECSGVPLCRVNREAFASQVPALVANLEWQQLTLGRDRPTL